MRIRVINIMHGLKLLNSVSFTSKSGPQDFHPDPLLGDPLIMSQML